MDALFSIFEIIGTVSFAISGAMEAVRHGMDLFGVAMLGLITACGGGVLRDLVIGAIPPRVFRNPLCAVLALAVALGVFIVLKCSRAALKHFQRAREMLYFLADTAGLAAFTVLGIESAGKDSNFALLMFVGIITATAAACCATCSRHRAQRVSKAHLRAGRRGRARWRTYC